MSNVSHFLGQEKTSNAKKKKNRIKKRMEEKENILKEGGVEEWGRELEEIGGEEVSDLVFLTSEVDF